MCHFQKWSVKDLHFPPVCLPKLSPGNFHEIKALCPVLKDFSAYFCPAHPRLDNDSSAVSLVDELLSFVFERVFLKRRVSIKLKLLKSRV
jgi:hypothetical protein